MLNEEHVWHNILSVHGDESLSPVKAGRFFNIHVFLRYNTLYKSN